MRVKQAGDEQAAVVGAVAVALHHHVGQPLERDGHPDCLAGRMHRQRYVLHLSTEFGQQARGAAHLVVDVSFGIGQPEALFDDADPQSIDAAAERLGVWRGQRTILPWIESVGAGQHLEEQGVIGHGGSHRAGVIERQLDRHDSAVRHQAVSRLHAVDAAE